MISGNDHRDTVGDIFPALEKMSRLLDKAGYQAARMAARQESETRRNPSSTAWRDNEWRSYEKTMLELMSVFQDCRDSRDFYGAAGNLPDDLTPEDVIEHLIESQNDLISQIVSLPIHVVEAIVAGGTCIEAGRGNAIPEDKKARRKAEAAAAVAEAYEHLPEYNNGKTAAKKWAAKKLGISWQELYRRLK